jgi:phosphomannomutase
VTIKLFFSKISLLYFTIFKRERQLFMLFPSHIFRSYDIRGLLNEVTPELARQVGRVVVHKIQAKTVVVGRDMRATSPELSAAAIEGIIEVGADVIDIGFCTTSLFNFAVSSLDHIDAGIMITASHNPAKYNGMKFCTGTGQPISGKEMYQDIEKEFFPAVTFGEVTKFDPVNDYVEKCLTTSGTPDLSGVKIVVDYGNGAGIVTVRPLLERMKANVIELYPEPDANFPNHESNPVKEETLVDLKAVILKEGADLGIALDGDADRIMFIDNEGVTIRGDLLVPFLSKELRSRIPEAKVVITVNQSWTSFEEIAASGSQAIVCPNGRTNVIATMKKEGADFGGEVSGHMMYKEFAYLESVDYTIVRTLSIWKKSGQTLADLVRPLRRYANSGEVNLEIHDKDAAIKKLEELYASKATSVNRLDGIRCEFDHEWWFIARLSNTEPILRLTVEATSEELMKKKIGELVKVVSE